MRISSRDEIETPQAVWLTSGTPKSVQQDVKNTVQRAADKGTVPVLVAYNIHSATVPSTRPVARPRSGLQGVDRWFRRGTGRQASGHHPQPDGLALLPTDCGQPDTYNRVALVNYAANALLRDPNAAIYLDAGHSAWHSVGDIAQRLVQGGVREYPGLFPERIELPVHDQLDPIWNLGLKMHRLRYRQSRRFRRVPEPVLERWASAVSDRTDDR